MAGDLGAFLTATRPRVLVEASPRDPVWGIGMTAGHTDAVRPSRWRWTNLLGFALMTVRDEP
ncbi:MAG TPA: NADAR domain-containing protein [Streptosporangiaceae bacterium]|nr:NADAR domain-containing protein [Streptosporangiaceae bacterium]